MCKKFFKGLFGGGQEQEAPALPEANYAGGKEAQVKETAVAAVEDTRFGGATSKKKKVGVPGLAL